jgi:arsenate reductase
MIDSRPCVQAAAVLLLCIAVSIGAAAASEQGAESPATILFVCEHGVGRSPIAAAYFNRLAKEKGLPYRATFRGTDPDAALPPIVRDGLTRDGFDVSALTPARVTPDDLRDAERIVVFGCLLPGRAAVEQKVIDVNGTPGPGDGYDQARDAIRKHVERLVESLASK